MGLATLRSAAAHTTSPAVKPHSPDRQKDRKSRASGFLWLLINHRRTNPKQTDEAPLFLRRQPRRGAGSSYGLFQGSSRGTYLTDSLTCDHQSSLEMSCHVESGRRAKRQFRIGPVMALVVSVVGTRAAAWPGLELGRQTRLTAAAAAEKRIKLTGNCPSRRTGGPSRTRTDRWGVTTTQPTNE